MKTDETKFANRFSRNQRVCKIKTSIDSIFPYFPIFSHISHQHLPKNRPSPWIFLGPPGAGDQPGIIPTLCKELFNEIQECDWDHGFNDSKRWYLKSKSYSWNSDESLFRFFGVAIMIVIYICTIYCWCSHNSGWTFGKGCPVNLLWFWATTLWLWLTVCHGKSPCCWWVNHLFLWAIYTMAMFNNQRVNNNKTINMILATLVFELFYVFFFKMWVKQ